MRNHAEHSVRKKEEIPVSEVILGSSNLLLLVNSGGGPIGTLAMYAIEGWSYLDSFYFTSFIATGQGPPGNLQRASARGKVFSSVLAFVSVGTVITALVFLFGPFLGRVLKVGEERLEEVEERVERRAES